jgi:hypothetical protein
MTTLSSIRSHIKRDFFILDNDTKYDSRIDDCIRTTLRSKEKDKWWFLERIGTMALSEGSDSATLPTDCGSVRKIDIITGSQRIELVDMTYPQLVNSYYGSYPIPTARPEAYALLDRTPYFSHTADQDYSLPIIYYAYDETLPTSDNDTSIWFGRDVQVMQNPAANNTAATIALETLKEQQRKQRRY